MDKAQQSKTVGPHHYGILNVRRMKNLHSCAQCQSDELEICYIVNVAVMWKRITDIYIPCCGKCYEKLQDCSVGKIM